MCSLYASSSWLQMLFIQYAYKYRGTVTEGACVFVYMNGSREQCEGEKFTSTLLLRMSHYHRHDNNDIA